jgi:hypothetical protein
MLLAPTAAQSYDLFKLDVPDMLRRHLVATADVCNRKHYDFCEVLFGKIEANRRDLTLNSDWVVMCPLRLDEIRLCSETKNFFSYYMARAGEPAYAYDYPCSLTFTFAYDNDSMILKYWTALCWPTDRPPLRASEPYLPPRPGQ